VKTGRTVLLRAHRWRAVHACFGSHPETAIDLLTSDIDAQFIGRLDMESHRLDDGFLRFDIGNSESGPLLDQRSELLPHGGERLRDVKAFRGAQRFSHLYKGGESVEPFVFQVGAQ
jgi:hypothetical protein